MFHRMSEIFKKSISEPRQRKSWQSSIGIAIFTLFVLSSIVVNESVQALNQAAGNYGYYAGTYGYNASVASSTALPNVPTSLSSSVTTGAITFSWTAPTMSTDGQSLDNLSGYYYQTGTSAVSTSCGASSNSTVDCTSSDTATSSASVSISGLACGTTRYIAVRAYDARLNLSSTALTGSATTSTCGTTATTSSGGGIPTGPTFPTASTTTTTVPVVSVPIVTTVTTTVTVNVAKDAATLAQAVGAVRNTVSETQNTAKVNSSAVEFKVALGAEVKAVAANFVTYGTTNAAVKALGSGERLAVVRDLLQTLGTVVANDSAKLLLAAEQISSGQKPTVRNLSKEVAQAGLARDMFRKLTGKAAPDFKNAKEDLAWNTMLYRIRFARDLNKERAGIAKYKAVFGKNPKTPLEWATVRAYGYALK